jgi:hypothetical protein
MRYLITHPDEKPFLTNWFDYENNYIENMIVYDLQNATYTVNGIDWIDIDIDNL